MSGRMPVRLSRARRHPDHVDRRGGEALEVIDLDDVAALRRNDPSDALSTLERTAEQWAVATQRAREAEGLPAGVTDVVFAGMGGSGIAGDVLAAIAAERGALPVVVCKGYTLPAHAGPSTLVIVSSYSGNTEETLSAFKQARGVGARVVALTTGGALARTCDEAGIPRIAPVEGLQPRAAFASLVAETLVIAERTGVLPALDDELAESEQVLAECAKALAPEQAGNEAKRIAGALEDKLPLIWGQEGVLAVAANRWRCQLNENAKVPAFASSLAELDHNEIVGYHERAPGLHNIALVVLRAPDEHPRIAARVDATLGVARPLVGSVSETWARGTSSVARLMSSAL